MLSSQHCVNQFYKVFLFSYFHLSSEHGVRADNDIITRHKHTHTAKLVWSDAMGFLSNCFVKPVATSELCERYSIFFYAISKFQRIEFCDRCHLNELLHKMQFIFINSHIIIKSSVTRLPHSPSTSTLLFFPLFASQISLMPDRMSVFVTKMK